MPRPILASVEKSASSWHINCAYLRHPRSGSMGKIDRNAAARGNPRIGARPDPDGGPACGLPLGRPFPTQVPFSAPPSSAPGVPRAARLHSPRPVRADPGHDVRGPAQVREAAHALGGRAAGKAGRLPDRACARIRAARRFGSLDSSARVPHNSGHVIQRRSQIQSRVRIQRKLGAWQKSRVRRTRISRHDRRHQPVNLGPDA